MIGISAYTENINAVIHLTKIIKSVLPKIIIVLGGAHVTFLPEEALHHNTVRLPVCRWRRRNDFCTTIGVP